MKWQVIYYLLKSQSIYFIYTKCSTISDKGQMMLLRWRLIISYFIYDIKIIWYLIISIKYQNYWTTIYFTHVNFYNFTNYFQIHYLLFSYAVTIILCSRLLSLFRRCGNWDFKELGLSSTEPSLTTMGVGQRLPAPAHLPVGVWVLRLTKHSISI